LPKGLPQMMFIQNTLKIIFVGIGATLCVDLWSMIQSFLKIKSLDYRYVGRWIAFFPKGTFFHDNIMKTAPAAGELLIGWTAHYLIGISFAFLLILFYGIEWLEEPAFYPALVTGIITAVAPLFIMQPAFGFGVASAKLANPNSRRIKSLITHIIYGTGLYISALLINHFI
jgi:Protein of unknown function (DUF2938)